MSTPLHTEDWQRLDARMLLVHPLTEVMKFLPALFFVVIAGAASGGLQPWHLLAVGAPVGLGVLRYLTTRFRITEGRVELQRGLLNRQVTATRLDRVRTVDLTSSPIHRMLGLTTVRIGTGVAGGDADNLDLDSLAREQAQWLRTALLRRSDDDAPDDGVVPEAREWARFHPSWLRFAPFTGAGLGVAAAAVGVAAQGIGGVFGWEWEIDSENAVLPGGVLITVLALGSLVAVLVLAVAGYAMINGNFSLTQQPGAWHIQRGLLTTRETTLDEDRLAGVRLLRPLLLRVARGAGVHAIVTGVDRSESSGSMLVPPAPLAVSERVAVGVVGDAAVRGPLSAHGPAATRRRWTRALLPAALAPLGAVLLVAFGGPWWPLIPACLGMLAAAGLAVDRARSLGHAHLGGRLISRSGSLLRSRDMLEDRHVIGWNLRATWFQRRLGLVTLTATTAGGRGYVEVLDVPEADAVVLAGAVLPDLTAPFLTTS